MLDVTTVSFINIARVTRQRVDGCVNAVDEKKITTATNLLTLDILRCICMGDECTQAKMRRALVFKGHSLGGSSIASL